MDKKTSFAKELTAILIKNKVLAEKEAVGLQKLFSESEHEYFDDFLLESGLVQKEDLLKALSDLYKVPSVDCDGYFFQTFLLHKFPKDVLHRNAFIPMDVADEDMLTVVASEPDDPRLLSLIGEFVSYDVVFRVGLRQDISDAITEFYDESLTVVPEDIDIRTLHSLDKGRIEEDIFKQTEEDMPISPDDEIDQ